MRRRNNSTVDKNGWTEEVEKYIIHIGNLCDMKAQMHEEEADRCHRWHFWLYICTISLATISIILPTISIIKQTSAVTDAMNVSMIIVGAVAFACHEFKRLGKFEDKKNDAIQIAGDYEMMRFSIDLILSKPYNRRNSADDYQSYLCNRYNGLTKYNPYIGPGIRKKYDSVTDIVVYRTKTLFGKPSISESKSTTEKDQDVKDQEIKDQNIQNEEIKDQEIQDDSSESKEYIINFYANKGKRGKKIAKEIEKQMKKGCLTKKDLELWSFINN